MIDPSFATAGDNGAATIHPYPPTMQELERKIIELESNLQSMTENWEYARNSLRAKTAMIDNLEEWLKEQHEYLDEDTVQSLADIFSLTLTKEYDVQVTVTFTGTVTAPLDYDMDELENALEARLDTSYYSGDVVVDFMEDNMDIDWRES